MSTATPKKREARVPFNEYLILMMDVAGVKNGQLASALGYNSVNIVTMLRNGAMQLPLNKVGAAAKALGVDKVTLLRRVLEERQPELLEILEEVMGPSLVSENEQKLLTYFRQELNGAEIDINRHANFIEGVRPLLHEVATKEHADHKASIAAMGRKSGRFTQKVQQAS